MSFLYFACSESSFAREHAKEMNLLLLNPISESMISRPKPELTNIQVWGPQVYLFANSIKESINQGYAHKYKRN
jgi:hypothetical protein